RPASTYIVGASWPAEGKAARLVMPWCNTEAMNHHLVEISARVAPGRHALLLLDQAGWHVSERLAVPATITIVPLPAKCPELNAQENVWQFLRDNWISNRVFASYDAIVDHCCHAWNKLVAQPWRIMSLGHRAWAPVTSVNVVEFGCRLRWPRIMRLRWKSMCASTSVSLSSMNAPSLGHLPRS